MPKGDGDTAEAATKIAAAIRALLILLVMRGAALGAAGNCVGIMPGRLSGDQRLIRQRRRAYRDALVAIKEIEGIYIHTVNEIAASELFG